LAWSFSACLRCSSLSRRSRGGTTLPCSFDLRLVRRKNLGAKNIQENVNGPNDRANAFCMKRWLKPNNDETSIAVVTFIGAPDYGSVQCR